VKFAQPAPYPHARNKPQGRPEVAPASWSAVLLHRFPPRPNLKATRSRPARPLCAPQPSKRQTCPPAHSNLISKQVRTQSPNHRRVKRARRPKSAGKSPSRNRRAISPQNESLRFKGYMMTPLNNVLPVRPANLIKFPGAHSLSLNPGATRACLTNNLPVPPIFQNASPSAFSVAKTQHPPTQRSSRSAPTLDLFHFLQIIHLVFSKPSPPPALLASHPTNTRINPVPIRVHSRFNPS
jgi:hypothetical protein